MSEPALSRWHFSGNNSHVVIGSDAFFLARRTAYAWLGVGPDEIAWNLTEAKADVETKMIGSDYGRKERHQVIRKRSEKTSEFGEWERFI